MEELITGKSSHHAVRAENSQEEEEQQREAAEDHVKLVEPYSVDLGPGLTKLSPNDRPADGVDDELNKDDLATPSMQEVEVVGDTGDDASNALVGAEQGGHGLESIEAGDDAV